MFGAQSEFERNLLTKFIFRNASTTVVDIDETTGLPLVQRSWELLEGVVAVDSCLVFRKC